MDRRKFLAAAAAAGLASVGIEDGFGAGKRGVGAKIRHNVQLLDDGGVLIEDDFGAEILLTSGSIHITCPVNRQGRA